METLFTAEQLSAITTEAESNTDYYLDTRVINGDATEISIMTISKDKQLIFVDGNDHTGFKHLRERHNLFSFQNYWVGANQNGVRLDNPSKFNPRMTPIIDYVKIADTIYSNENKNVTKNNKPDLFDKFSGTYKGDDGKEETYHLITYKNSKIVHSLFPEKKTHNRKRKCRFGKGIVTTTTKYPEGYNDLFVPYEGPGGIIVYSILARKYYLEKIERLYVQKHDETGEPITRYLLSERNFEKHEKFEREDMNWFQLSDLTDFEKIITQIDEEEKG